MLFDQTIKELALAWHFKTLWLYGNDFFDSGNLKNQRIKDWNTGREDEKYIEVLNKNKEKKKILFFKKILEFANTQKKSLSFVFRVFRAIKAHNSLLAKENKIL